MKGILFHLTIYYGSLSDIVRSAYLVYNVWAHTRVCTRKCEQSAEDRTQRLSHTRQGMYLRLCMYVCVYLHVCVCASARVCVCACTSWHQRLIFGVFSIVLLHSILGDRFSLNLELAYSARLAGQLAPGVLPSSPPRVVITGVSQPLHECWALNSGLHAYTESTFPTESFPQLLLLYLESKLTS